MPCLVVFSFVMFCCCLLELFSFLRGKGLGVNLGKKRGKLGGVKEGEIVVRMDYVREESIIN